MKVDKKRGEGLERTFRGIVHVLDICAPRLVSFVVIGIVEAIVLSFVLVKASVRFVFAHSSRANKRNKIQYLVIAALHIFGIIIVHRSCDSRGRSISGTNGVQ